MTIEGDSAGIIKRTDFNRFQVVIHNSQISYGSVRSKINTESAGIIMETKTVGDTLVCYFDLTHHAGFRFKPGRNSVEIEAADSRRRVLYASFLLTVGNPTVERPTGPLRAAPEDIRGVEKYAVVIGVSRYKDRGIPALQFADRDAQAVRDFLLSANGGQFAPEKIMYLVNEEANLKNIRTALYTFLTAARKEDMVFIYYAGHGSPDPNDRRNLYLLPYDTEIYNMGGTAFPMWEIQDVFSRIIKAQRIVTLTDACHSAGISGDSAVVASGPRPSIGQRRDLQFEPAPNGHGNNLFNQYMARYAGEGRKAVLTASDISELSMEGELWGGGHGVFTYFVLEGLKGKADRNNDGVVTAGELFDYVRDQVALATKQRQNPTALAGLARDLPMSRLALHSRSQQ
ncbi:MAG TPA: caspase family protein [Candidatus Angelobacter sp.]|nr:caspase family protein [Candidatus Angelobacter sp.]